MVKVNRSGKFNEELKILSTDNLELNEFVEKQILLFTKNPDDTRIDNHPLAKRMEGKWAFSVTDDIRIVYEWIGKTTVRFLAIGPHQGVYRKS